MNKRSILFVSLFSLTMIVAVALPFYSTHAAGLVPCGTTENPRMCGFCDFFVLIKNVIDFLLVDILTPVAVLFIVIGGIMVLTGGAKPGNIQQGKKIITETLLGVFIIFSAWMITNTILQLFTGDNNISQNWYSISCNVESGSSVGGSTPIPTVTTPGPGKTPVPTPTPPVVSGNDLLCTAQNPDAWKKFVKPVSNPNAWQKCVQYGGGICKDCISVEGGSLKVSRNLGNFLNNKLTPALKAAGVSGPYYNQGMCPTSPHANCAHFNGHAMDISTHADPARTEKICKALNELLKPYGGGPSSSEGSGATYQYVVEDPNDPGNTNPNSACPKMCGHVVNGKGSCGSGIHLNIY